MSTMEAGRRSRSTVVRWLVGSALVLGCSNTPVLLPPSSCLPGAQTACACLGGASGVQVCGLDRVLGPCQCAGGDAGADSGAAIDGGLDGDAALDAGEIIDAGIDVGVTSDIGIDTGAVLCSPASTRCNPASQQQVQTCSADGARWVDGATCSAPGGCVAGACVDPCGIVDARRPYLGCDHWPTTTLNTALDPQFAFAVALVNPQPFAVRATITGGGLGAARTVDLAAGAVETVGLPWVQEIVQFNPRNVGCRAQAGETCPDAHTYPAGSVLQRGGAYHVRSNAPIAAYQFNPLAYSREGGFYSFSNDASLLLPQRSLRGRYLVSTWANSTSLSMTAGGFVTVVGVAEGDTSVTVRASTATAAGTGVAAMAAGAERTFSLRAGDVLELVGAGAGDLTGTTIEASAPVAVFTGHDCATVPADRPACDHLEEQLPPSESWGREYVVSALIDRGPGVPSVIRIVSLADDNPVRFDPPDVHDGRTLRAGELLELSTNRSFRVTGAQPLLVAQFMLGQGPASGGLMAGDPAMTFETAVTQYRPDIAFFVPSTFSQNFVNVVAPTGASLLLDGSPLAATPTAVGAFSVYALPVTGGAHRVRSVDGRAFGLKVYGVAPYTSYLYSGGLDL